MKPKSNSRPKFTLWLVLLLTAALIVNVTVVLVYALHKKSDPELYKPDRSEAPVLTYALNTLQDSEALRRYLQAYEAQGMSMEAIVLPVDSYTEKLNSLLLADMGPDLFEVPPTRTDTYRRKQWLRPLSGLDLRGSEAGSPSSDAEEVFVLPTHWQSIWLVCNQSLLEKAGVANPPQTLGEFREAAEKISSSNSGYGRYGFLLPMYGNQEYELTLIEKAAAAGGDNFWDEESRTFHFEVLEPYFAVLSSMRVSGALSPDCQMATHESALLQFLEGNIGMILLDNLQLHTLESAELPFTYTISVPPSVSGTAAVIETPEGALAVHANSVLTDEDIRRLFSPEFFACLSEDEGFRPLSAGSFASSRFARRYGFTENSAQQLSFKNNVYTYQRFAVYLSAWEGNVSCREKLEALSQTLSGSPAARK